MSKYISTEQLIEGIYKYNPVITNSKFNSSINASCEYGDFSISNYSSQFGINYKEFHARFNEDTILENKKADSTGFIIYNCGESITLEDNSNKKQAKFANNICFTGEQSTEYESNTLCAKNKKVVLHHITFDENLFKDLTQSNEDYKKAKKIYQSDYINVNYNNYINFKQDQLLKELKNLSTLDNRLKLLYFESKILDLMYTTFDSLEVNKKTLDINLSSQDIESLHRAKELILKDIQNPPSLKELAYKSNINEFKLKKGFKYLFNNTVFGYLQEYRLKEAKKLLESDYISIQEASFLVGYKSVPHFSRIFKEYYGYAPLEIKKASKEIYLF